MKVLLATTNQAKIRAYRGALEEKGVEVLTLADMDFELEVEETGESVLENAALKARMFGERSEIPTVAIDNGLWIESVKGHEQPGVEVRRVAGKRLDDEEMIRHYTRIIAKYGGRLAAKWQFGVAVYIKGDVAQYLLELGGFDLVAEACTARRPGYPMDSVSILPTGKYVAEQPIGEDGSGEKSREVREVTDFVVRVLRRDGE